MRLLIEVSGQIDNWHRALVASKDAPRLPLPFSCTAAFMAAGHQVSAISFLDDAFACAERGAFEKLYGPSELTCALAENDIAFLWAGSGIKAIASNRRSSPSQKKVLLGSYVWRVPRAASWKVHGLAVATRLAARFARGAVLMTDEQTNQAVKTLGGVVPVSKFTWGIDSGFYRTAGTETEVLPEVRQELPELLREPYVILAGDQQRLDRDAVELVERFGLRLVRVPQERETAAWYRREISERGLKGRLFVFEHVTYPTLRFLFQHALAYAGLVDSTWQPAGWTVLCEALASGTPAVVYDGLTAREMHYLGAGDYLITVPYADISAVASACGQIRIRDGTSDLSARAQTFSAKVLDLQRTAPAFVREVEAIFAGRQTGKVKALLAHPGTQHSFQLARELDRNLVLQSFYTGLAWRSGGLFDRVMMMTSPRVSKRLANRKVQRLLHATLHRRSGIELSALWKLNRGMDEQEVMHRRNELFQRSILSEALRGADVVIGVDTASWILAERCRELRIPFVLDQSIGHPDAKQAMYDALRRQFPDWREGFEERRPVVWDAEMSEHRDATAIVLASSFARQTLVEQGVPEEKIRIIPYGVDRVRFQPPADRSERPFRFVFVGIITARKGIPLLLEAWKRLGRTDAELWLVGPASAQVRAALPNLPGLKLKRAVPQVDIPGFLQQCDVFVFPSYFEGFGLVILEAMACGLPVITTTATGGPDIITQGDDGWVDEPGTLDTLIETMRFCVENRDRVSEMGANARATAEQFSWEIYGERWVEVLTEICG
jgi:starch synthase